MTFAQQLKEEYKQEFMSTFAQQLKEEYKQEFMSTFAQQLKEEYKQEFMNTLAQQLEQKGLQQGLEQGRREEDLVIAKRMLNMGMDHNIIKKATGLSDQDLLNLEA